MIDPFSLPLNSSHKHASKAGLVEEYDTLSLSSLGRGLLKRSEDDKRGIIVSDVALWPRVKYSVKKNMQDGSKTLMVWYRVSEKHLPIFQEIQLRGITVTFGVRPYMICPECNSLRLKLQFNKQGLARCRDCLNLAYESTRMNHAKPIFQMLRRYMKIKLKSVEVRRIDYAGRYTRKANSVMKMSVKWLSASERRKVEDDLLALYANRLHRS